ncbi:hypothetical protein [Zymobacter palmae]|uniref:hypothetical protein n=1 Tax=Zymobacter palmae TaxID=33074 RepID=UPI0004885F84|nr:hypothetical protein [Zymobacter palmae]
MSPRKEKGLWTLCAVWCAGLLVLGYGLMPRGVSTVSSTALVKPQTAVPDIAAGEVACWPSLMASSVAAPVAEPATRRHEALRGSVISHGQVFVIQQDASGHLYRRSVPVEHATHNDKRPRHEDEVRAAYNAGKLHDSTSSRGVVDGISDIRHCGAERLANSGTADGAGTGLSSPTY